MQRYVIVILLEAAALLKNKHTVVLSRELCVPKVKRTGKRFKKQEKQQRWGGHWNADKY